MTFKLLGVGSPLTDYSLAVSDTELNKIVSDGKGCTRSISHQERSAILSKYPHISRTPGGSAANTVRALAKLGGQAALFGKIGSDEDGKFFRSELRNSGADDSLLIETPIQKTGYCLSLITPDAERTMLSNLGASLDITLDDLEKIPFADFNIMLMEGYLAAEPWSIPLLKKAKKNNILIALDLNNFELVRKKREYFYDLINDYVDILFANEAEINALIHSGYPLDIHKKIPSPAFIIVKQGERGSLFVCSEKHTPVEAVKVDVIKDTTGAGDFYAAGFFYGLSQEMNSKKCCRAGSYCAAAIIEETGTLLNDDRWNELRQIMKDLKNERIS